MAPRLVAFALFVIALGVVPLVVVGGTALGAAVGAMWASAAWSVGVFIAHAAGAGPRLMGADAEIRTAEELSQLPAGWWWRHNVLLEDARGDVDHVVGGPGGVFALETKWTASRSPAGFLRSATAQARVNAEKIRPRLRSGGVVVDVKPVVVSWSRHASTSSEMAGVPVVRGSELREWLVARPAELDEGSVAAAGAAIDAYLLVRRPGDGPEITRFEEAGISGVLTDVAASVLAGLATVYVLGALLSATTWTIAGAAAAIFIVGAMVLRRRRPRFAPHAVGVLASAVGIAVIAAAVVVHALLV